MSFTNDDYIKAKQSLDKVIDKGRVHLYKPIQIAEVLRKVRFKEAGIDIETLETYRTKSRKWRNEVSAKLVGNVSTSSARYQDDVFNDNATPPSILKILAYYNNQHNGAVEAYIYKKLQETHAVLGQAIKYCNEATIVDFRLEDLLSLFWNVQNLRRSIDKVYEAVVYALFSTLIDAIEFEVEVSYSTDKTYLLQEFETFAQKVIGVDSSSNSFKFNANVHRVGVANAADRGLDMWANFGPAIQIKHLTLKEELAEDIVSGITADRIVIVCQDAEEKVIVSLMSQLGWKSRIQSIINETELCQWYERAMRGTYAKELGDTLIKKLSNELRAEFPTTSEIVNFMDERDYNDISDTLFVITEDNG
jgi:hypothetical protein